MSKHYRQDAYGETMIIEIAPGTNWIAIYCDHARISPDSLSEIHIDLDPESIVVSAPGIPYRPVICLTAWDAADMAVEFMASMLCVAVGCLDGIADEIRRALLSQICDGDQFPLLVPENTPAMHAA